MLADNVGYCCDSPLEMSAKLTVTTEIYRQQEAAETLGEDPRSSHYDACGERAEMIVNGFHFRSGTKG